jgi:hypothetical protein
VPADPRRSWRASQKGPSGPTHLLCFDVTQTRHPESVVDQNQFGTDKALIGNTRFLCLPSFKKLIEPTHGLREAALATLPAHVAPVAPRRPLSGRAG